MKFKNKNVKLVFITIYIIMFHSLTCLSQIKEEKKTSKKVQLINIKRIGEIQDSASSCIIFKFWIPNCLTAVQQFKEYMDFSKKYNGLVIFIGITNMPQKIIDIALKNNFTGTVYMLDTAIAKDIHKRFDVICEQIPLKYHLKKVDFNTLLIDKKKALLKNVDGFPPSFLKLCS